eukprot:TRINITY_DN22514_c0_g1_i1.p5 TRINITY_DN22514_c0_g1~~TRINITY_DN22514_c0_g1_i1.p5  ORF type:complete len:100 (-),score=9.18 TRINITY_DN22514_c0_g1_i1:88-387(-)
MLVAPPSTWFVDDVVFGSWLWFDRSGSRPMMRRNSARLPKIDSRVRSECAKLRRWNGLSANMHRVPKVHGTTRHVAEPCSAGAGRFGSGDEPRRFAELP